MAVPDALVAATPLDLVARLAIIRRLMTTLGIDFGGTSVKAGICGPDGLIETLPPLPTAGFGSPDALIDAMAAWISSTAKSHPGLAAVGVGVPGFVDFHSGMTFKLTNVPNWENIPLRDRLREATGLPVIIENDANCMAYAEWRIGAGRGSRHMIAITLGTGVGGGIIIDGQLHRGANSGAGEIGQCSIDWQGRHGVYQNPGCLEQYIGNRQISEMAREAYANAGKTPPDPDCPPHALAAAAEKGDPVALEVWENVAAMLASALCAACWLINPETIVIGGGVANAGDVLFSRLKRRMREQMHPRFTESLRITHARFGSEAGIIGAAALAADTTSTVDRPASA